MQISIDAAGRLSFCRPAPRARRDSANPASFDRVVLVPLLVIVKLHNVQVAQTPKILGAHLAHKFTKAHAKMHEGKRRTGYKCQ